MTDQHLRERFSQPDFWANYFLDEYAREVPGQVVDERDEDDDEDEGVAEYGVGGGHTLLVECSRYEHTLKLSHPGSARPVELGFDDSAHWHPHALRWSEVDLVCRATALADPEAGYPGPYLAVLGRFAPICDETEAALALPLVSEAFAGLPGLDRYQRRTYASHADMRASGWRWMQDGATGWWYPDYPHEDAGGDATHGHDGDPDAEDYVGGDLYSLREPGDSEFPFAALAAAMDLARARCGALRQQSWAAEAPVQLAAETFGGHPSAAYRASLVDALRAAGCADRAVLDALAPDAGDLRALVMAELLLGVEPGSLVRARSGSETPRPPRRYNAHAYLPVPVDAPREGVASRLKPHLNAALRAAGLGTTGYGPAQLGGEHPAHGLPIELLDDWRAGLELVREVLRTSGAPENSTVEVRRRGEVVRADLEQSLPTD